MKKYGITVPLSTAGPLAQQQEIISSLPDLGYTDAWSSESFATDGFTPLALTSVWAPQLRLGVAIAPVFTRGPALLAQTAASLAQAAPGRFVLGIGTSSDVIVERWNATAFDRPWHRVRDTIRFLRSALAGEKVTDDYETFSVKGFRLAALPPEPVPILVAALRPGMLRLAASEGDGAILNWLSADDAGRVSAIVREANPEAEIVARLFVCPTDNAEIARAIGRRSMAAYVNVPVYKAFHQWLGRSDVLGRHWELWDAGDRAGALEAIPDEVVDDLIVWGSPDACRQKIARYVENGVTTPMLALTCPPGVSELDAVAELAPQKG